MLYILKYIFKPKWFGDILYKNLKFVSSYQKVQKLCNLIFINKLFSSKLYI